jgi:uncharacterized membrane protein YdjX (TVP38/TMEM64 family)
MGWRRRHNIARAVIGVLLILPASVWLVTPLPLIAAVLGGLLQLREWLDGAGLWGLVVYVLVYALAVVLLFPGSLLALSAGLAYGPWGVPLAVSGATIGAALSFLISRYVAGAWFRRLRRRRLLLALENAVIEGGWRFVCLVRLSPLLPFGLLNYYFGVTRIPFRQYLPGTVLGIIPGTSVNVLVASAGYAYTLGGLHHPLKLALLAVGITVTVLVCRIVILRVRKVLRQAQASLERG